MNAPAVADTAPVATIDLSAIEHNHAEIRRVVGADVRVLAMVKGDAYGHGAREVSACLARVGCDGFGVATLDEAREIRGALDSEAQIIVFGGLLADEADGAIDAGVEVVAGDATMVEALAARAKAAGTVCRVHLEIDTGMSRLGVEPAAARELAEIILAAPGLELAALCSHFAEAEAVTDDATRAQLDALRAVARSLAEPVPCHVANSAGLMATADAHLDMVRPGIALYGLASTASKVGSMSLRAAMQLDAVVVRVADVPAGRGVSYGRTFETTRPSRLATLRLGYADGYPRALSNLGEAVVTGEGGTMRAPVVGRVCMDHTVVDVTDAGPVEPGDRLMLWGQELRADELAAKIDTIAYELVSRLGRRVRRRYVNRA